MQQILDSHQTKPPPRTHNCLCTGTLGKEGRAMEWSSLKREFSFKNIQAQKDMVDLL